MLHSRMKRVEAEYRQMLGHILDEDISDPRLEMASVTHVEVSRDLREAIVYVSILNDDEDAQQDALSALNTAKGYIKRKLAQRISLKRLPDPHFRMDDSEREAFRLFGIMDGIDKDEPQQEDPS